MSKYIIDQSDNTVPYAEMKREDFELRFDNSVKIMQDKCKKYEESMAKRLAIFMTI